MEGLAESCTLLRSDPWAGAEEVPEPSEVFPHAMLDILIVLDGLAMGPP